MIQRSTVRAFTPAALGLAGLVVCQTGCSLLDRVRAPASQPQPAVQATVEPAPARPQVVQLVRAADPDLMLFGVDPLGQLDPPLSRPPLPAQQQTFAEVGRDFDPDVDAAGRQIVFASTRHCDTPNLYLQSAGGKAVTQLTDDPASEIQPRFSPDSRRIAFASDRAGQWDIYILDLDSRTVSQVTRNEAHELAPCWSPDGKWLAYSRLSAQSGEWELWLASVQDHTQRCIGPGMLARWSPDGTQLTFQRARQRDGQLFSIWTVRLTDGEPGWPTEVISEPDAALIAPAFSPDGRRIVYCRVPAQPAGEPGHARPTQAQIWSVQTDGAGRTRLTDGGASFTPCWAADGRVFFSSDRDGRERIWSLRLPGALKQEMAAGNP